MQVLTPPKPPERAVDGNYDQLQSPQNEVCTRNRYANAWWKFTFNFDVLIQRIQIYGRGDIYAWELDNAVVEVYDEESNLQECGSVGMMGTNAKTVVCDTLLRGRSVRVRKYQSNAVVQLCEIDFYGIKLS